MVSNNSKSAKDFFFFLVDAKDYLIHVRIWQTIIIKWYKYLLLFFFVERINILLEKGRRRNMIEIVKFVYVMIIDYFSLSISCFNKPCDNPL